MKSCPYDHAEMQGYGHDKCPYCRMPLAAINGPSCSDTPETEARTFVAAMELPLVGEEPTGKKAIAALIRHLIYGDIEAQSLEILGGDCPDHEQFQTLDDEQRTRLACAACVKFWLEN
jgi:Fe-S-cluster-containing dehydrogenase component